MPLPIGTRGIVIDAGFFRPVIITGEPVGERYIDINFCRRAIALDYWVRLGQLIEERVFSNVGEALKRISSPGPAELSGPTGRSLMNLKSAI